MSERMYIERSLGTEVYPHLRTAIGLVDPLLPKIAVDVGCGAGRDALFLVDCGYTVYAFDKSEAAIAKLGLLGGIHLGNRLFSRVCSFEDVNYPNHL